MKDQGGVNITMLAGQPTAARACGNQVRRSSFRYWAWNSSSVRAALPKVREAPPFSGTPTVRFPAIGRAQKSEWRWTWLKILAHIPDQLSSAPQRESYTFCATSSPAGSRLSECRFGVVVASWIPSVERTFSMSACWHGRQQGISTLVGRSRRPPDALRCYLVRCDIAWLSRTGSNLNEFCSCSGGSPADPQRIENGGCGDP
jgi:hypothetical protein